MSINVLSLLDGGANIETNSIYLDNLSGTGFRNRMHTIPLPSARSRFNDPPTFTLSSRELFELDFREQGPDSCSFNIHNKGPTGARERDFQPGCGFLVVHDFPEFVLRFRIS